MNHYIDWEIKILKNIEKYWKILKNIEKYFKKSMKCDERKATW